MKKAVKWLTAIVALFLVASIAVSSEKVMAQTASGGDEQDRTVVIGLTGDPEALNPAALQGSAHQVGGMVYDGLLAANPDLSEMRPELATSYEVSEDGRVFTFHLREGVKWHDGEPFTSADVKWSLENINVNHPIGRQYMQRMESIETPDDHTVVFTLTEPFGPFLTALSGGTGGAILPKHIGEKSSDPLTDVTLNREPIGTGPFMFKEWIPGQSISLTRNPDYWGEQPWLDEILFTIVPDQTALLLSLEAGEVDWIDEEFVDRSRIGEFVDNPDIDIVTETEVPSVLWIHPNHRRDPLGDVRVRQALYMGIDREFLHDAVYAGLAVTPTTMIDSRLPQAATDEVNLLKMYPYDVEAANKLLDEAGYPRDEQGVRFELDFIYEGGRQGFDETVEAVSAMWAELGVIAPPHPAERAVVIDSVFQKRDFDVTLQSYNTLSDPALGVARGFICEDDAKPLNFGNPTGFCDPEIDALFEEGAKAALLEDRRPPYQKLQVKLAELLTSLPVNGNRAAGLASNSWDFSEPRTEFYRGNSGAGWIHVKPSN